MNPTTDEARWIELCEYFLSGELDHTGRAELHDFIANDPVRRALLLEALATDLVLRSANEAQAGERTLAAVRALVQDDRAIQHRRRHHGVPTPPTQWWQRAGGKAVAAVVAGLAAAVIAAVMFHQSGAAPIADNSEVGIAIHVDPAAGGEVRRQGRSLALVTGTKLARGDRIVVTGTTAPGSGAVATLDLFNGSTIDLWPGTTVTIPGGLAPVLDLAQGRLRADTGSLPARGLHLRVTTPLAELVSEGTVFAVAHGAWGSTMTVDVGAVRVANPFGSLHVAVGERCLVEPSKAPRLVVLRRCLFVTTTGRDPANDGAVIAAVAACGFEVIQDEDGRALLAAHPPGPSDLVVISGAISSADHLEWTDALRDVPVPVLSWEARGYVRLGLAEAKIALPQGAAGPLTVVAPGHPAAGGASGTIAPYPATEVHATTAVATPGSGATVIATAGGYPALFVYERGAALIGGGTAPARRVALFLGSGAGGGAMPTDEARVLIDAAVRWCVQAP